MVVNYSGGTDQQRRWVAEAIAASLYPYDGLPVTVDFTWASSTPCGTAHTYMCTQDHGDGTFTITIEDRADDPTYTEVAGLPNPAADVEDFYKQSVIHELGHVTHETLINTDELRAQIAALFWSISKNRAGTLADFWVAGDVHWIDSIAEAVAECMKCACYTGRAIYKNRTHWLISEADWGAFTAMFSGGGGALYRLGDGWVGWGNPYQALPGVPTWFFMGINPDTGQPRWTLDDQGVPLYQPNEMVWVNTILPEFPGFLTPSDYAYWITGDPAGPISDWAWYAGPAASPALLHYDKYTSVTLHWNFSDEWWAARPRIEVYWWGEPYVFNPIYGTSTSWSYFPQPDLPDGSGEYGAPELMNVPTQSGSVGLPRRPGMSQPEPVGERVDTVAIQLYLDRPGLTAPPYSMDGDYTELSSAVWLEFDGGAPVVLPYPFAPIAGQIAGGNLGGGVLRSRQHGNIAARQLQNARIVGGSLSGS